ncbi:MAG: hypothetical protein QM564_04000 [Bergeyella sp.]
MKKLLFILFISVSFFSIAQTTEAEYLQQEHERLERVAGYEVAIQNYIDQNIGSYALSAIASNKINAEEDEDGNLFTGNELAEKILNAKKQALRKQYFDQNPNIVADYSATPIYSSIPCVNNGFENGDTSGFSFYSERFNSSWSIYNNFPTESVSPSTNGIITLVDNTQNDANVPTLPRVKSGNYAIRLNNSTDGNYDVSMMRRLFLVDKDNLTFNYALVLQDPDHGATQNPYYQCIVKTETGEIIFERRIVADKNNTDIFNTVNSGTVVYTGWVCENIDTSQYVGQTLILELIVGDCGLGGHWGYAYFDDFCGVKCSAPTFGSITLNPIGITCPLLPLTVSGNFIAPAGYELQDLYLYIYDLSQSAVAPPKTLDNYTIFGNSFSFSVKNIDFFPEGDVSDKGFDFKVRGVFKLIGSTSTTEVVSQSANSGNDVTFNTTCNICSTCEQPN